MHTPTARIVSTLVALFAIPFVGCNSGGGTVTLSSAPEAVDFGQVVVGQQAVTSLSISNSGDGVASILEPTFADGSAATFASEARPWPFTLASGASLALQITYSPTAVGGDEATLLFSRDGNDGTEQLLQVSLSGTGIPVPGADADGDGYISDQEGGDDCNDADAAINPGAVDLCDDGIDNNCDGFIDVGPDDDSDSYDACVDCDDTDINTYPGATELCDEVDNNCDNEVDNEVEYVDWYPDGDLDGYGDPLGMTVNDCAPVDGYAAASDDCNDADPTVHPNATELCNGIDEDCDTVVPLDEFDDDGDGYSECTWVGSSATITGGDDCDDTDATSHPGATEICDGADNDCDTNTEAAGGEADDDFDGERGCDGDCNDNDNTIYSTATELCDAIDSDCDTSLVDEFDDLDGDGDPDCTDPDADGDGDPATTDCDDLNAAVHNDGASGSPDAVEFCDLVDSDCNGSLIDGFTNFDGDSEPDCVDADDDNDTVDDGTDTAPNDPNVCGDSDGDTCEDCISGTSDPANDGNDLDADGLCDVGDSDADGDNDSNTTDCDDFNAAIFTGNTETCSNDVDDDCDATSTCVSMTQGGVTQVIAPYAGTVDAVAFYNAGTRQASSNTNLEVENHVVEMLYQEPASEGSEIFMTLFIDSNRDSGTTGNITIEGTGFTGLTGAIVNDDNSESISIDSNGDFSNSWGWATCCNDGAVIGPLAMDFCVTLTITSHSSSITGISTYDDGSVVTVADDTANPVIGSITDTVTFCEDY